MSYNVYNYWKKIMCIILQQQRNFIQYSQYMYNWLCRNRSGYRIQRNNIQNPDIHTTSIQNWHSSRWCPTLFNIYTADLPPPRAPVQVMVYAYDITIPSKHTRPRAAKTYIHPYLLKVQHNNLTINPDKRTCTLFTPDPAEYKSNLDLQINNPALHMATHAKVLGLILDSKLTYSTHIHNISVHAHKPQQIIKALTATGWGNQKETLMRPSLQYAPTSPCLTIQTENITSITHPTQTYNRIQHSKIENTIFNNGCQTTKFPSTLTHSLHHT